MYRKFVILCPQTAHVVLVAFIWHTALTTLLCFFFYFPSVNSSNFLERFDTCSHISICIYQWIYRSYFFFCVFYLCFCYDISNAISVFQDLCAHTISTHHNILRDFIFIWRPLKWYIFLVLTIGKLIKRASVFMIQIVTYDNIIIISICYIDRW